MNDTVNCPYCGHEHDMSDGLTDLPSDNRFDQECHNEACGREFEVVVEFTPSYSAAEINYVKCEICEKETRDIREKGRIFPYPEAVQQEKICSRCWMDAMGKEMLSEEAKS